MTFDFFLFLFEYTCRTFDILFTPIVPGANAPVKCGTLAKKEIAISKSF